MKVVTDYDAILNDDSINCVVELMGGVTDAKEVSSRQTRAACLTGKQRSLHQWQDESDMAGSPSFSGVGDLVWVWVWVFYVALLSRRGGCAANASTLGAFVRLTAR